MLIRPKLLVLLGKGLFLAFKLITFSLSEIGGLGFEKVGGLWLVEVSILNLMAD